MDDPMKFARDWIDAWNRRDVEGVLLHYADEVEFTSPTALRVVPDSGGVVHGRTALRDYWVRALTMNPDLEFTLIGVYTGIDTIVLHYRNQLGGLVNEVMTFRDGQIVRGHATHLQLNGGLPSVENDDGSRGKGRSTS